MSGGSYDYAFGRIDDLANAIRENAGCRNLTGEKPDEYGSPPSLRRAFAEHLRKVARAAQAIEWNDSGDGDRNEQRLIRECIAPGAELAVAVDHARAALAALQSALTESEKGGGR